MVEGCYEEKDGMWRIVREKLEAVGFQLAPTTPEEHDRILRAQIATLSKVVRLAGVRPK